jgi:hypothetical protein
MRAAPSLSCISHPNQERTMAKKTQSQPQTVVEPPAEETQAPAARAAPAPREAGGPPQGIVTRLRKSGNPILDFHRKHRRVPMIDPASLIVDGKDPVLALPKEGGGVAIKRVAADTAAELLTCDFITGGQPIQRLATDAEVAAYEADQEARIARAGKRK